VSTAAALIGIALALLGLRPLLGVAGASSQASSGPGAHSWGRSFLQGGERIRSLESNIDLHKDGSVSITETIEYDFGSASRHGIYRIIPVRFPLNETEVRRLDPKADMSVDWERVTPVTEVRVSSPDGNTPVGVETETNNTNFVIRIGDPDRTVTGVHTYVISYRLGGVVNGFDDSDELYLNVTGNGWEIPMDSVSATLAAPGTINAVRCLQGPYGGTDVCSQADILGDDNAEFSAHGMNAGDAVTIVARMPKGVLDTPRPILDQVWSARHAFTVSPATVAGSGGVLALLMAAVGVAGFRVGRDRRYVGSPTDQAFGNESGEEERVPLFGKDPIQVEFTPPDGLPPGLIGTLIDEVAHPLDVTATIVDLAVRGYLRIEEVPDEGLFSSTDYRLVKLRDTTGLASYELLLMDHLFASGDAVLLSSLKTKFRPQLREVQDGLYREVLRHGWYRRSPDRQRLRWSGIAVMVILAGVGLTVLLAMYTSWGWAGIAVILGGVALAIGAQKMPARTAKGTAVYRRTLGFREMFLAGEGERQAWAEEQNLFSRYLPYAIVFGLTDKWASTFEKLAAEGLVPPDSIGWWYSPRPFDWYVFSRSMDSFSTAAAGQLSAAAPPSASAGGSSGFGGGGFSGGGFGGGGGGSW
jgi:uncharacterized membrane protein YgcG